jgi:hypothetical protein
MNYETATPDLLAKVRELGLGIKRLGHALGHTVAHVIEGKVTARMEVLRAENPTARYWPKAELERIGNTLRQEETTRSQLVASGARQVVQQLAREVERDYRPLVAAYRADVGRTCPNAYAGLDPAGMVQVAVLKELRRPAVAKATPRELKELARRGAQLDAGPAARVDLELVHQRFQAAVAAGGGLASDLKDVGDVQELTDYLNFLADARVPEELAEVEDVLQDAGRAVSLADVAHVRPVDITHPANASAKAAYEDAEAEFQEALAASAAAEGAV